MNQNDANALLKAVLDFVGEHETGSYYQAALGELEQDGLEAFLKSNTLWGGAGSIADQAGINGGRPTRRVIEGLLVELGDFQIEAGILNPRTKGWVETFKEWETKGV